MRVMRSNCVHQAVAFGFRNAEQVGVEKHVFFDGQIAIQPETLRHVADLVFDGIDLARHIMARHPRLAFGGIEQTAEQAQGGGFARAIRALPTQKSRLAATSRLR